MKALMKALAISMARALGAALVLAAAPAFAAPVFTYGVQTSGFVEAFAVNPYIQPGISRNVTSNGPIADAASASFGTSTADSSASVDAAGLKASASVHNLSADGTTATARSLVAIVNPFYVIPRAGFSGTQASIQIGYHLGGALNDTPGCSTCFEFVQADLGVDGMSDQFHFLGAHSMGTINNANGNVTGVDMGGTLTGLVPVNTELFLRAGLYVGVHCQSFTGANCDASSLFGAFNYFGLSTDLVDIVWGLPPRLPDVPSTTGVPEPASAALLLLGVGLLRLTRRRL